MNIQELENLAHKARATLLNIYNTGIDSGEPRVLRAFLSAYSVGDMPAVHKALADVQECVGEAAAKVRADMLAAGVLVELEQLGWEISPCATGALLNDCAWCKVSSNTRGAITVRLSGGARDVFQDDTPRAIALWVASNAGN